MSDLQALQVPIAIVSTISTFGIAALCFAKWWPNASASFNNNLGQAPVAFVATTNTGKEEDGLFQQGSLPNTMMPTESKSGPQFITVDRVHVVTKTLDPLLLTFTEYETSTVTETSARYSRHAASIARMHFDSEFDEREDKPRRAWTHWWFEFLVATIFFQIGMVVATFVGLSPPMNFPRKGAATEESSKPVLLQGPQEFWVEKSAYAAKLVQQDPAYTATMEFLGRLFDKAVLPLDRQQIAQGLVQDLRRRVIENKDQASALFCTSEDHIEAFAAAKRKTQSHMAKYPESVLSTLSEMLHSEKNPFAKSALLPLLLNEAKENADLIQQFTSGVYAACPSHPSDPPLPKPTPTLSLVPSRNPHKPTGRPVAPTVSNRRSSVGDTPIIGHQQPDVSPERNPHNDHVRQVSTLLTEACVNEAWIMANMPAVNAAIWDRSFRQGDWSTESARGVAKQLWLLHEGTVRTPALRRLGFRDGRKHPDFYKASNTFRAPDPWEISSESDESDTPDTVEDSPVADGPEAPVVPPEVVSHDTKTVQKVEDLEKPFSAIQPISSRFVGATVASPEVASHDVEAVQKIEDPEKPFSETQPTSSGLSDVETPAPRVGLASEIADYVVASQTGVQASGDQSGNDSTISSTLSDLETLPSPFLKPSVAADDTNASPIDLQAGESLEPGVQARLMFRDYSDTDSLFDSGASSSDDSEPAPSLAQNPASDPVVSVSSEGKASLSASVLNETSGYPLAPLPASEAQASSGGSPRRAEQPGSVEKPPIVDNGDHEHPQDLMTAPTEDKLATTDRNYDQAAVLAWMNPKLSDPELQQQPLEVSGHRQTTSAKFASVEDIVDDAAAPLESTVAAGGWTLLPTANDTNVWDWDKELSNYESGHRLTADFLEERSTDPAVVRAADSDIFTNEVQPMELTPAVSNQVQQAPNILSQMPQNTLQALPPAPTIAEPEYDPFADDDSNMDGFEAMGQALSTAFNPLPYVHQHTASPAAAGGDIMDSVEHYGEVESWSQPQQPTPMATPQPELSGLVPGLGQVMDFDDAEPRPMMQPDLAEFLNLPPDTNDLAQELVMLGPIAEFLNLPQDGEEDVQFQNVLMNDRQMVNALQSTPNQQVSPVVSFEMPEQTGGQGVFALDAADSMPVDFDYMRGQGGFTFSAALPPPAGIDFTSADNRGDLEGESGMDATSTPVVFTPQDLTIDPAFPDNDLGNTIDPRHLENNGTIDPRLIWNNDLDITEDSSIPHHDDSVYSTTQNSNATATAAPTAALPGPSSPVQPNHYGQNSAQSRSPTSVHSNSGRVANVNYYPSTSSSTGGAVLPSTAEHEQPNKTSKFVSEIGAMVGRDSGDSSSDGGPSSDGLPEWSRSMSSMQSAHKTSTTDRGNPPPAPVRKIRQPKSLKAKSQNLPEEDPGLIGGPQQENSGLFQPGSEPAEDQGDGHQGKRRCDVSTRKVTAKLKPLFSVPSMKKAEDEQTAPGAEADDASMTSEDSSTSKKERTAEEINAAAEKMMSKWKAGHEGTKSTFQLTEKVEVFVETNNDALSALSQRVRRLTTMKPARSSKIFERVTDAYQAVVDFQGIWQNLSSKMTWQQTHYQRKRVEAMVECLEMTAKLEELLRRNTTYKVMRRTTKALLPYETGEDERAEIEEGEDERLNCEMWWNEIWASSEKRGSQAFDDVNEVKKDVQTEYEKLDNEQQQMQKEADADERKRLLEELEKDGFGSDLSDVDEDILLAAEDDPVLKAQMEEKRAEKAEERVREAAAEARRGKRRKDEFQGRKG